MVACSVYKQLCFQTHIFSTSTRNKHSDLLFHFLCNVLYTCAHINVYIYLFIYKHMKEYVMEIASI